MLAIARTPATARKQLTARKKALKVGTNEKVMYAGLEGGTMIGIYLDRGDGCSFVFKLCRHLV
jgi:hypothetical protein